MSIDSLKRHFKYYRMFPITEILKLIFYYALTIIICLALIWNSYSLFLLKHSDLLLYKFIKVVLNLWLFCWNAYNLKYVLSQIDLHKTKFKVVKSVYTIVKFIINNPKAKVESTSDNDFILNHIREMETAFNEAENCTNYNR